MSPWSENVAVPGAAAAIDSWNPTCRHFAYDENPGWVPVTCSFSLTIATVTSLSTSRTGSGRSSTAYTTEKMAEFAPVPNASASTATAVTPGLRSSIRTAKRMSPIKVRKKSSVNSDTDT